MVSFAISEGLSGCCVGKNGWLERASGESLVRRCCKYLQDHCDGKAGRSGWLERYLGGRVRETRCLVDEGVTESRHGF